MSRKPYVVRKHCRKSSRCKNPNRACVKSTGESGVYVGPYNVPRKPKEALPPLPRNDPSTPTKRPSPIKRSSSPRKSPLPKAGQSPTSRVFHKISEEQGRPSILAFRQHCAFKFPHPILLHTRTGIELPRHINLVMTIALQWRLFEYELCKQLPFHKDCVISYSGGVPITMKQKFLGSAETRFAYAGSWFALAPATIPKILVGVRTFRREEAGKPTGAHTVFFEAHFATRTVHVVDPNGTSPSYEALVKNYFRDWHVHTTHVYRLNISDATALRGVKSGMQLLGFGMSFHEETGGNCCTIANYYLVDYMCTRQWERTLAAEEPGSFVDRGYARDHFFRASRDWLYSNEELTHRRVSPVALQIRLFLMARYISYQLVAYLTSNDPEFKKKLRAADFKTPQKKSMITLSALPSTFEGDIMTSHYRVTTDKGEQDVRFTGSTTPLETVAGAGQEMLAKRLF